MTNDIPVGRGLWTDSPLYLFLVHNLPTHVTKRGALDVRRIHRDLTRSHERVYQWLRTSKLTPANAMAICQLASSPENVAALAAEGREPPQIQDFNRFVFVD